MFFTTYHSSLLDPLTYLRFFTHVLGHSGWAHFFGNASYLLLLGPMLEEKYGSRILIETIAITAFVTGIVNYIFFRNVGLCGASGVVFAFIMLASFTGFDEGEIPLTFILVVIVFLGQQLFEGITVSDNISNMAHITGGITGACIGYLFNNCQREFSILCQGGDESHERVKGRKENIHSTFLLILCRLYDIIIISIKYC